MVLSSISLKDFKEISSVGSPNKDINKSFGSSDESPGDAMDNTVIKKTHKLCCHSIAQTGLIIKLKKRPKLIRFNTILTKEPQQVISIYGLALFP